MVQRRFFYDDEEVDRLQMRASVWGFLIGAFLVGATWALIHFVR